MAIAARLWLAEDGRAELRLEEPRYGVSPGQAAVLADGTRVLGGGWITQAEMRMAA